MKIDTEGMNLRLEYDVETKSLEMSRYIDLQMYHQIERSHAYYEEMLAEIIKAVVNYSQNRPAPILVLEIGAGTGILTKELLELDMLQIDALDLDEECIKSHREHINNSRCRQICGDAVTYNQPGKYDILVSAFAHDHIPYEKKSEFAFNIDLNLKQGGLYIMGGEILPYYYDDISRRRSLYDYHCHIIDIALRNEHFELAQLEINALKSGLNKVGDFKRHEAEFEAEMASSGLYLVEKQKMGPLQRNDLGGVYVYVYEKQ